MNIILNVKEESGASRAVGDRKRSAVGCLLRGAGVVIVQIEEKIEREDGTPINQLCRFVSMNVSQPIDYCPNAIQDVSVYIGDNFSDVKALRYCGDYLCFLGYQKSLVKLCNLGIKISSCPQMKVQSLYCCSVLISPTSDISKIHRHSSI